MIFTKHKVQCIKHFKIYKSCLISQLLISTIKTIKKEKKNLGTICRDLVFALQTTNKSLKLVKTL